MSIKSMRVSLEAILTNGFILGCFESAFGALWYAFAIGVISDYEYDFLFRACVAAEGR